MSRITNDFSVYLFYKLTASLLTVFRDHCLNVVNFGFLRDSSVTAFDEGWGLYAENPLVAHDTGQ